MHLGVSICLTCSGRVERNLRNDQIRRIRTCAFGSLLSTLVAFASVAYAGIESTAAVQAEVQNQIRPANLTAGSDGSPLDASPSVALSGTDPSGAKGAPTGMQSRDNMLQWPFVGGGVTTVLRFFAAREAIQNGIDRHAQTANVRVRVDSGLTSGTVGVGLDAAVFGAVDLLSSANAGNMAHVNADYARAAGRAWAFVGEYGIRLQHSNDILRYGLQQFSNPFLESRDNRGLPPSFRGVSAAAKLCDRVRVEAGAVNASVPRGMTVAQPLSTTYGNIPVRGFGFAGLAYDDGRGTTASLYRGEAQNVWNQYFASANLVFGNVKDAHVTTSAAVYVTRNAGRSLEGPINTAAYSLSLGTGFGPTSISIGYQRIVGRQFFDYLAETSGIALSNVYGVDYNAPREQSFVLALSPNASTWGWPGFKPTLWHLQGWGADGSDSARLHPLSSDPLHSLYWKNGEPIKGSHHEIGIILEHVGAQGKGAKKKLIVVRHWSSRYYSDDPFYALKLTVEQSF